MLLKQILHILHKKRLIRNLLSNTPNRYVLPANFVDIYYGYCVTEAKRSGVGARIRM